MVHSDKITKQELNWAIDSTRNNSVYVIDGKKLRVTPMEQTIVPPPMCAYDISFPNYISAVAVNHNNDVAVITEKNEFFVMSPSVKGKLKYLFAFLYLVLHWS